MPQSFIPRWILGHKPNVEIALRRLEQTLFAWSERWEQGPIPGAYIVLTFMDTGTVSVGTKRDGRTIPCDLRPIAVQAWLAVDNCTIDLNDDGTSILTTPLVTSGNVGSLRKRGDFASDNILGLSQVTMDVDAISGTPSRLRVDLWCKHPSKVEDV